jgi:tetratricopeptide (TPR) repeat protein
MQGFVSIGRNRKTSGWFGRCAVFRPAPLERQTERAHGIAPGVLRNSNEGKAMKPITRTIVYLAAMVPLATSCTKSNYNLSSNDRAMLTQVRESRLQNAPIAPAPKILPETHFAAGRMFEEQGQFGKAIDQYRKATAVNHKYTAAYHRLGLLFSKLSHHEHAVEALKKAVDLAPNNPRLRNNLGFELMFLKRWGEAETHLRKAIEMDPGFARAHINLAMVLCKQDRFDEALARFMVVLPEPDAYYNIGLLYRGQRRYGEASAAFEHVLALNPRFSAAQKQLEELAKLPGDDVENRPAARTVQASERQLNPTGGFSMRDDAAAQDFRQPKPGTGSSAPVGGRQPVRDFTASSRLAGAQPGHTGDSSATSATSTNSRVSRVRGRSAQSTRSIPEQAPLLASSVVSVSSSAFDDPDCEDDTVLTARTQSDRDRFRPTKMTDATKLPHQADQYADGSFNRPQQLVRGMAVNEQRARAGSMSGRASYPPIQPTTLRDYASLQLDERGPEALVFILNHDPSNRVPETKPPSKPVLVKDRPVSPRNERPAGKPRTDARGWPAFLDPILRDSAFHRALYQDVPRETYANKSTTSPDRDTDGHTAAWSMDFGGLNTLADVVANEFICLAGRDGAWPHQAGVPLDAENDAWPLFDGASPIHATGLESNDAICPADMIVDVRAGASVLLIQPKPVCEPGTTDDDTDTVSVGDAGSHNPTVSPGAFIRMPPLRR